MGVMGMHIRKFLKFAVLCICRLGMGFFVILTLFFSFGSKLSLVRQREVKCVGSDVCLLLLSLIQQALNEQMKNVLEENVSLQKQLIKAENKLLSSRLKKIPNMQDRGQCLNT